MFPSCPAGRHDAETALVLCVSEEAARAHRRLFSLPAEVYMTPEACDAGTVLSPLPFLLERLEHLGRHCTSAEADRPLYLQLVVDWGTLLALILRNDQGRSEVKVAPLLEAAGMGHGEAQDLAAAGRDRIFTRLCRDKRLDVVRRLCRMVKKQIKDSVPPPAGLRADCHLFAAEPKGLAASSL